MARLPRLTARGWALGGIALALYFFANQTQVGWLYVLSALAAGLLLVCAPLPGAMLRGLTLARRIESAGTDAVAELHAGRPAVLSLLWRQRGRVPGLLLEAHDTYTFALPGERQQTFFMPLVPAGAETPLDLTLTVARRGWHPFGPVPVTTRAPFGLFRAQRLITPAGAEGALVFPAYRPIEHLALLDRQPAIEHSLTRVGAGGEFAGVREYRPGDPRRHIHWRSTARAGRLIVKEFTEERQPGLTLALDLRAASALGGEEDNTFEVALQVAASLAHYAHRHGLPVYLAANSRHWPAPSGAVSWWGLMHYLARVQVEGEASLAETLLSAPLTSSLAVMLPAPDAEAASALLELRQGGQAVLAAVVDPGPFVGDSAPHTLQARTMAAGMAASGVSAILVTGAWEEALAQA